LEDFPTLIAADLSAAWEYVRQNGAEIRDAIARQGRNR
jgi:uncharacterized protein (DUF433 family)